MCGIAGIIGADGIDNARVKAMIEPLAHRGPNDSGVWVDPVLGVGLGHRRLSIIDLSASGHQPMVSSSGRFVMVFNGEIYNHQAIRAELDRLGQMAWRGHSDSETLLTAIDTWGLDRALEKAVGMFALAIWDRHQRRLSLARDRFGEKPLYYGRVGRDFVFGSELKALRAHPHFDNPVDRDALRLYASRAYVPAPLSIYSGIYKLEPGCILEVEHGRASDICGSPPVEGLGHPALRRYWSYRQVVEEGLRDPFKSHGEALEALDVALSTAIRGQSIADVPVGAFLSGGIDSSLVTALYQKYADKPVRTFTIGFDDPAFNEAPYARAVAAHLKTDHAELYLSANDVLATIPSMPTIYDEPFADSSQVPTYLVSKFAREHVTVALSGDGGDELFGGYNRYFGAAQLWSKMDLLPAPVRSVVGAGFGRLSPSVWDGIGKLLPGGIRPPHFGTKVQKAFRTMASAQGIDDVFMGFLDEWSGVPSPVLDSQPSNRCRFDLSVAGASDASIRMMYCDAVSYLPDDILCKVDRAAMAVSLETRVPFLDHRVAATAARIPIDMKIRTGKGKLILRDLLYREAPPALFERPKAGFGMPLGSWLRGPLRPWAESLLEERQLREGGFFDAALVRQRWSEHLAGKRDAGPTLWAILTFEEWRRSLSELAPQKQRAAG